MTSVSNHIELSKTLSALKSDLNVMQHIRIGLMRNDFCRLCSSGGTVLLCSCNTQQKHAGKLEAAHLLKVLPLKG